jgi:hypothetical protein
MEKDEEERERERRKLSFMSSIGLQGYSENKTT